MLPQGTEDPEVNHINVIKRKEELDGFMVSQVHTPDVKLSLRTAKQLYAGKSEWRISKSWIHQLFGKILILNGHVLFSDADDFVYNEMTVHVPMAVHPNPKKVLVIGGGDGGVAQVLTLYPELEQIDIVEPDEMLVESLS